MTPESRLALSLLVLQVIALIVLIVQGAGQAPRYEYDVSCPYDELLDAELERRGSDGWSIATARRATSGVGDACYEIIWIREA